MQYDFEGVPLWKGGFYVSGSCEVEPWHEEYEITRISLDQNDETVIVPDDVDFFDVVAQALYAERDAEIIEALCEHDDDFRRLLNSLSDVKQHGGAR